MVKIRLKRLGRKKTPFYRIVVTDIRSRRNGAPLQELGYYNPLSKELKLDKAAATDWIAKGAAPTETAKYLIDKAPATGELIVLEVAKKERLSKKAKEKAQAAEAAAKEAAKAAQEAKEAAAAAPAEEATETPAEEPVAETAAAE